MALLTINLIELNPIPANLIGAQLVERPDDWLDRDEAENVYRAKWAKRENLTYRDPFPKIPEQDMEARFQADLKAALATSKKLDVERYRTNRATNHAVTASNPFEKTQARDPEKQFQISWKRQREIYLSNLKKPVLDGRDLRNANIHGAFLPGISLQKARLGAADLSRAWLEGVDLRWVWSEGANFREAQLKDANFVEARLKGADLYRVHLKDADLTMAQLVGVDLRGAQLEGADLTLAHPEGAYLQEARLIGTSAKVLYPNTTLLIAAHFSASALREVDLSKTELSKLVNFENSFGDASVALPKGTKPPCQWGRKTLDGAEYFGRWRGWLEAKPGFSLLFHRDLKKYKAIPPPPGCTWKAEK